MKRQSIYMIFACNDPNMQATPSIIQVSCYSDLNDTVEKEIRRLLKCSEHRTPVCLTAEPYTRFRCRVLEMLASSPGDDKDNVATVYLSQGLVARAKRSSANGRVVDVSISWQELHASNQEEGDCFQGDEQKKKKKTKSSAPPTSPPTCNADATKKRSRRKVYPTCEI